MPTVKVSISKPILTWVARQPGVEFLNSELTSRLHDWIEDIAEPTFNQIMNISNATGIPFGYFFLNEPPVEEISLLQFRSIDNDEVEEPSWELINTIHQMERIQDWIKDYRNENAYTELSFVGSLSITSGANKIASEIMNYLELDYEWFRDLKSKNEAFKFLRSRLNEVGITVMLNGVSGNNTHKPLSVKEFRAFCLVDKLAPLIFINNTDSEGAKIFSLLHETAHIWLGENDLFNDWKQSGISDRKIEQICNAVASLILIPNDSFKNEWTSQINTDLFLKIENLSNIFNSSTSAIARKALDFDFISQTEYEKIIEKAIEDYNRCQKMKKKTGGNYYATLNSKLDSRFVSALYTSVREGKTSYSEAFQLTNTNNKTFWKIVSHGEFN